MIQSGNVPAIISFAICFENILETLETISEAALFVKVKSKISFGFTPLLSK